MNDIFEEEARWRVRLYYHRQRYNSIKEADNFMDEVKTAMDDDTCWHDWTEYGLLSIMKKSRADWGKEKKRYAPYSLYAHNLVPYPSTKIEKCSCGRGYAIEGEWCAVCDDEAVVRGICAENKRLINQLKKEAKNVHASHSGAVAVDVGGNHCRPARRAD